MNLPGIEDRTIIVGRTGSGKTYAGLFLLSEMPIDEMPWVIIDYKRERNIAQIPYAEYITLGQIPSEPGVYIVQPLHTQDVEMEAFLMAIWETENIGLYIDEGVMLPKSDALDVILIQGRSKNIPVILLSQRPVGISRFAFSEASIIQVFPSHDKRDQKTISEFTPLFKDRNSRDDLLPLYHSHYYDVKSQSLEKLKPVPPIGAIMETFREKLEPEDEINDDASSSHTGHLERAAMRYVEL